LCNKCSKKEKEEGEGEEEEEKEENKKEKKKKKKKEKKTRGGGVRLGGGRQWWECEVPQHHRHEFLAHLSLLLEPTKFDKLGSLQGLKEARDKEGQGVQLGPPFYFSFFFQIFKPGAQVWHQSKPTNIYIYIYISFFHPFEGFDPNFG